MFFHGAEQADQGPPEMSQGPEGQGNAGDGRHHHTIDEDEGGGYHSTHTHPDGHTDEQDHADYDDASDHMDQSFGHGEGEGGDEEDHGEVADFTGSEDEDIAGTYGRKARG